MIPVGEFRPCRGQFGLESFVEPTDPEFAPVHGREDLDVVDRVHVIAPGNPSAGEIHRHGGRLGGVVADDEEEIGVGVVGVADGHGARVDPVGVDHDPALLGLTKDVIEPDHRDDGGGDEVAKDVSGSHRGQLVGIADEDQSAARGDGLEEVGGELDVEHGNLVHDHHVGFEGPLAVTVELAGAGVELQQAVDGAGAGSGRLFEALCGPSRRRRQQYPLLLRAENLGEALNQSGLAGARSSRDDENPAGERRRKRLALSLSEIDLDTPLVPVQSGFDVEYRGRSMCGAARGCCRQPWPRRLRVGGRRRRARHLLAQRRSRVGVG